LKIVYADVDGLSKVVGFKPFITIKERVKSFLSSTEYIKLKNLEVKKCLMERTY